MKGWMTWLEQRTGIVTLGRKYLYEPLPGGTRWRYTWLSVLLFAFFVQAVTGFFLLTQYSASTQTAWESVFFLQTQVPGGSFLRGLHSISAQCFVMLVVVHLFQTIFHRAHLPPRELNYWLLLLLVPLAIGSSVTGWLLPFDQKGYWAARVPLNILSVVPLVGPPLQRVLMGGAEIGHLTLTRFAALHTVFLPLLIGTMLGLHWGLTRKHGLASGASGVRSTQTYWPHQALKDVLVCLALTVVVVLIVFWPWLTRRGAPGVELLAPADPAEPYAAARPEWFMLWLFQFLKLFPGGTEVWGAVVIPVLVLGGFALLPWLGRWRRAGAITGVFLVALTFGILVLTAIAWNADRRDPSFQSARDEAREQAERIQSLALAPTGIPAAGALTLLEHDPLTQGPILFARHCAQCHRFNGRDGRGIVLTAPQSASDLKGFASREWLTGFLDPAHIVTTNYFGGTKFAEGKMVRFVKKKLTDLTPEEQTQLQKMIMAVSAEASLPAQTEADERDAALIAEGRQLMTDADFTCRDCHQFREPDPDATAPDLTGYGSREWLVQFITNPGHARFYGKKNDRMPAYGTEHILDDEAIGLVADWLRGDWYEPKLVGDAP